MDPYEAFRTDLQDALNHLHDPDYQAPATMASIIGAGTSGCTSSIQYAIIQAIQRLAPPPETPGSASIQASYELLVHRFIENLTQGEVADVFHTTVRNIRRKQRVATHILARLLWEEHVRSASTRGIKEKSRGFLQPAALAGVEVAPSTAPGTVPSRRLRAQAKSELASLRECDPGAIASVGDVIHRSVKVERALTEVYGVTVTVGEIAEDLTAMVHPAALRQILIMSIGRLSRLGEPAQILLDAWEEGGFVVVRLRRLGCCDISEEDALTADMLDLLGGSLVTVFTGTSVDVGIRVPAVGTVDVVVVDDNQDFVYYCQRCVRGTRFRIVQPNAWTAAAIREAGPDVILLDIMLPEVDGWELLETLQHDPDTSNIPVVVCSIVREEALASLMGAVEYLPKPIDHRDLLATLDRVVTGLITVPISSLAGEQHPGERQ